MKLTDVIKVLDELDVKDTGELRYCDLEVAIEKVCGVENDVDSSIPATRVPERE